MIAGTAPVGSALLQGGQPSQHSGIVLPRGFTCPTRVRGNGLAQFQGIGLHADGDLGVSVGRVQADVPQPSPDDVHFDARLQQMNRGGMSAMS